MMRPLLSLLILATACGLATGCAETPKHQWPKDSGRLLTDVDLLQGWSIPKKIAPVVGDFDVTYTDQSANDEACAYADGPDRSITICEKNGAPKRTGYRATGPTTAM